MRNLVPELFDHQMTRFPLDGEHQGLGCQACHKSDTAFRHTPADCNSCHRDDDVHRKALGSKCETCHRTDGWKNTTFNHDLATDFVLKGAHRSASCAACHSDSRYEGTPRECVGCHRGDDSHQGSRGDDCATCHTVAAWQETSFDHRIETGFALQGAHTTLECSNCHLKDMALREPPTSCAGCHASHDPHQGRNGNKCSDCHTQTNWELKFDHAAETGFVLSGAHGHLACAQCHSGPLTDPLPKECSACHEKDDPHRDGAGKGLGTCERCHSTSDWNKNLSFSHDLTTFPLLGGHRIAACDQCHDGLKFSVLVGGAAAASAMSNDNKPKAVACNDCHAADDMHKGTLGSQCSQCHNPVAWSLWEFDHDKSTDFPLTGAHTDLVCAACHTPATGESPRPVCNACHRADDIHSGGFGRECASCHVTSSFSTIEMRRAP